MFLKLPIFPFSPFSGAVAVHCKAGLGRTGTCIGAYMMKHHKLTAEETIGWLRIVRPGSVIGQQQQYMKSMQAKLWREGDLYEARMRRAEGGEGNMPPPDSSRQGSSNKSRRKVSDSAASITADMKGMSLGAALSRNTPRDARDIAAEEAEGAEATQGDLLRIQRAAASRSHAHASESSNGALPSIIVSSTTSSSISVSSTGGRVKTPPVGGGSQTSRGAVSSLFSRNGKSSSNGKTTPPSPMSRFMSSFRDK